MKAFGVGGGIEGVVCGIHDFLAVFCSILRASDP